MSIEEQVALYRGITEGFFLWGLFCVACIIFYRWVLPIFRTFYGVFVSAVAMILYVVELPLWLVNRRRIRISEPVANFLYRIDIFSMYINWWEDFKFEEVEEKERKVIERRARKKAKRRKRTQKSDDGIVIHSYRTNISISPDK